MSKAKFSTVEAYITHSDPDAQPIMNQLREIITSTIPKVEEKISWGVPFYRHHGPLGGFAVYQQHISFGAAADLPDEDRKLLEDKGYIIGVKTVRIRFDQPVPAEEIRQLLKFQLHVNLEEKERCSAQSRRST